MCSSGCWFLDSNCSTGITIPVSTSPVESREYCTKERNDGARKCMSLFWVSMEEECSSSVRCRLGGLAAVAWWVLQVDCECMVSRKNVMLSSLSLLLDFRGWGWKLRLLLDSAIFSVCGLYLNWGGYWISSEIIEDLWRSLKKISDFGGKTIEIVRDCFEII